MEKKADNNRLHSIHKEPPAGSIKTVKPSNAYIKLRLPMSSKEPLHANACSGLIDNNSQPYKMPGQTNAVPSLMPKTTGD